MSDEQRKLMLEIQELELKVKTLKTPYWEKPGSWFSTAATAVALIGVFFQGYLSSINSAQAKLDLAMAEKSKREANESLVAIQNEFASWKTVKAPFEVTATTTFEQIKDNEFKYRARISLEFDDDRDLSRVERVDYIGREPKTNSATDGDGGEPNKTNVRIYVTSTDPEDNFEVTYKTNTGYRAMIVIFTLTDGKSFMALHTQAAAFAEAQSQLPN